MPCRVTCQLGDFVGLADSIPPADIVTLERVLNVYPEWELLASLSAKRARRLYWRGCPSRHKLREVRYLRDESRPAAATTASPRDRFPINEHERVGRENGLSQCFVQTVGPAWQVVLYRRA